MEPRTYWKDHTGRKITPMFAIGGVTTTFATDAPNFEADFLFRAGDRCTGIPFTVGRHSQKHRPFGSDKPFGTFHLHNQIRAPPDAKDFAGTSYFTFAQDPLLRLNHLDKTGN